MAYIFGSRQNATTTTATGLTGVEIKVFEGVYTEGGVNFPINLPLSYRIIVNGVTFAKNHFQELTPTKIALDNYILEGDNVQLEVLELF